MTVRIDAPAAETFVGRIFQACGLRDEDAGEVTAALIHAELRGRKSHGLALLPWYVELLSSGAIDPSARPSVVADSGGALVVDARNAMGHVAAAYGMRTALSRAKTTGVALCAVRGSNHCGALGYYAMLALDDAVGVAASHAVPTMAMPGGRDRVLGASPIAVAIPGGAGTPVVLDISFAAAARSRIVHYAERSEPLPPGWATDRQGNPTVDPAAALSGLLIPAGGHKGAGLALAIGMLTALLSGGAYGAELGSLDTGALPGRDSQLLIAIMIEALVDPHVFRQRVDNVVRQIDRSIPIDPDRPPRTPGARAAEMEADQRQHGLEVDADLIDRLRRLAEGLAVDPHPFD